MRYLVTWGFIIGISFIEASISMLLLPINAVLDKYKITHFTSDLL